MPQVIIVSNRLPVSVNKKDGQLVFSTSIGGLATGLESYVKRRQNRWIGWPGIASDELTNADKELIVAELDKSNCTPVFLTKRQIDDFYNGYSNQILWPLFHNLRRPSLRSDVHQRFWQTYRQVNRKFAEAALNEAETGGQIWIHDYQLMLAPEMVRAERPNSIIGFFLHIPWPEAKNMSKLAEADRLVNGVLGADVAGFHTPSYVANFTDSCVAADFIKTDRGEILINDRTVRIADFPMGIDYQKYAVAGRSGRVKQSVKAYRQKYRGQKVIASVDRLDPSKGLIGRVQAYGGLLKEYPKLRGKVVFAMVAAPSRMDVPAYQRLSKDLQAEVNALNKKYGTAKWQPIDYINEAQPFEDVTALFRAADVAFIAPFKDGMNLAAKEFVASRKGSGVLILSQTAGAAEQLKDAIIVDPSSLDSMIAGLHQALVMRRRELRRRLRHMQQDLSSNTVQDWAKEFVNNLSQPIPGTGTVNLRQNLRRQLINDYRKATKRLLLLDYDGSLVPFSQDYRKAAPPKSLLSLLEKLAANPYNDVVLISGRDSEDLENWFGDLPINLVAEHGAASKKAGAERWQNIEKVDTKWKHDIQPIIEKYTALTPGARMEVKPHSLVWHYREASPYHASKYAVIIKRLIKPYLKHYKLELMQGSKVLEIKNRRIGKGQAARTWLKPSYGLVLALGDDVTDEELFAVLPESSDKQKIYAIKVGRGRTLAGYRLSASRDALSLLKKLN